MAEARIVDAAGTTTRIMFSGEQRNVTLKPEMFTFTPPAGVDVVKPADLLSRAPCRRSTWCASSTCRRSTTPINQTLKEVGQRFDFKGTPTEVRREEHALHLRSADDFKVRALADILQEKLARRQVPLRALVEQPIEPGPAGSAKQRLDAAAGHRRPTRRARSSS